jgi:hypothetical protein
MLRRTSFSKVINSTGLPVGGFEGLKTVSTHLHFHDNFIILFGGMFLKVFVKFVNEKI